MSEPIIFDKFYLGEGKSESDLNGFDKLTNADIHTTFGKVQCQLVGSLDNHTTVDESTVTCEDRSGQVYFFSSESGKIWKRTAGGTFSLVNTNTNGAHQGAKYFNGNLYYASQYKLGKFDGSTWSDSFATFSNNSLYHPMIEMNLSLFIGDSTYIAAVDSAGTFSANSLDIPTGAAASCFAMAGNDILIGTYTGTTTMRNTAYLWDTYSSSWTIEDEVYEVGFNCFIQLDNGIAAQCGLAGRIYIWNGSRFDKWKKIRGVTTGTGYQRSTVFNGKALFVVGDKVYSIHRTENDLPLAITQEYTSTTDPTYALAVSNAQLFMASTAGVDKIGTDYATATIDTPEVTGNYQNVIVNYDSLPTGTSIGISTKIDGATAWTAQTAITDTINKRVYFDGGLGDVNFLQARITLTPSGASTPIITSIIFQ